MKRTIIVALLIVLMAGVLVYFIKYKPYAHTIHWQLYSESLIADAKKHHQPVFIFAGASYCQWCQQTETINFVDPAIVNVINGHFLPVSLDTDANVSAVGRYHIEDLPTFIFIDNEGKEIDRYAGYLNTNQMIDLINLVLKKNQGIK